VLTARIGDKGGREPRVLANGVSLLFSFLFFLFFFTFLSFLVFELPRVIDMDESAQRLAVG
jgi:hypothetical protein